MLLQQAKTMSSSGGEGGRSFISEEVVEKLKYFYENGTSERWNNDEVEVGELNLGRYGIKDEILEEIILEWFIKNKLIDKIVRLQQV